MSAAIAVTGFVIDEIRKMVSSATGGPPPASSVPATPWWTSPRRATSHDAPTTLPPSTWPPTTSSKRLIPSVVNPAAIDPRSRPLGPFDCLLAHCRLLARPTTGDVHRGPDSSAPARLPVMATSPHTVAGLVDAADFVRFVAPG